MSRSSTFVFFVLFLSGSTNQSRPKFSGPSTFAKNVFWPVLISAVDLEFCFGNQTAHDRPVEIYGTIIIV